MITMEINLASIGMAKGRQYETIITTKNSDNTSNAAPIGVLYAGGNIVLSRIFKGSHTLENIIEKKEYIVNITHDPELFMLSTLGNLDVECFSEDNSLKDADAYFKCKVISLKEAVKQSDPIKKNGEAIVIKSEVVELIVNNETKAFNRGFGYVIETLSNLSRFDLVDETQKQHYLDRFREAKRIVNKVGYKEDIEAMNESHKVMANASPSLKKAFSSYVLMHFNVIMVRENYALSNSLSYKEKVRNMKQVLNVPIFKEAYQDLSMKASLKPRYLPFLLMKCHLYCLAGLIYVLRVKQNARKK